MHRRRLTAALATLAMAATLPTAASAQTDWPTKPIKLIVPFPPGGTSDVMGRMVADELSKVLRQPVVVENVGGAGGVIGTERGARAAPDGYTIVQTGVGQSAVAHGLDPNLKYDSDTDFVHVSQVHSGPNLLVVNPQTPFRTVKDVVDFARTSPGKLDYGFTHAASGHMAMELFKQTACAAAGGKAGACQPLAMVGIPYRGGGPMMTAILGNEVPMMFINQDVALPHVKAGKLRVIAVTSLQRNPLYPDVPTFAEAGVADYEAYTWNCLFAPKAVPRPIIERLNRELNRALADADIRTRLEGYGAENLAGSTPESADAFGAAQRARWVPAVRAMNIKLE